MNRCDFESFLQGYTLPLPPESLYQRLRDDVQTIWFFQKIRKNSYRSHRLGFGLLGLASILMMADRLRSDDAEFSLTII